MYTIVWKAFSSSDDAFPSHPNGYRQSRACPVLRGQNFCPHCLCSPCVIALPPEFLRGYCSPHPANDEKRYRLYRLFWALLSTLGVWRDEEYLQMKESRTSRDDRREIIPKCIITVSRNQIKLKVVQKYQYLYSQEVRRRYPSFDGQYRDYMSTFEAESAVE